MNGLINLQFKADSGDNEFSTKSATLKCLIKLPKQGHQYHHIEVTAGYIEPIDERVNTCVKSLVRCGCRCMKKL